MRLVMISLDSAFQEDAPTLLSMPNLGKLAEEGVFCDNVQTIYPSLTYPIHTSLLTGCYPDKHGIDHNERYTPDVPAHKRPWYWDARDIQVETLHQAAHRAGREVASILWPVSGRNPAIRYNLPEVHALPGENQTLKALRYGTLGWLLRSELKYGRTRPSIKQPHLDRFAVLLAEQLISKQYNPRNHATDVEPSARLRNSHMPDVLSLHLVALDAARHQDGVQSSDAKAALARLDRHVGRILEALNHAGVLEDVVVAVMSDHGQADISRVVALDAWLKAEGIPARAQTLGMGAYIRCDRGDYQRVLDSLLANQQMLSIRQVYTRQDLRRMKAPEGVLLAVDAVDGVEFVDNLDADAHAANHGFGPELPGAKCLLWMSGPPFLRGARLREAHVVDIAPTLAQAVRLELPQAQGRVLREAFKPAVSQEGTW